MRMVIYLSVFFPKKSFRAKKILGKISFEEVQSLPMSVKIRFLAASLFSYVNYSRKTQDNETRNKWRKSFVIMKDKNKENVVINLTRFIICDLKSWEGMVEEDERRGGGEGRRKRKKGSIKNKGASEKRTR